jgi:M6 family metalloprotease-like protein
VTNGTESFFSKGTSGLISPSDLQALFIPALEQLEDDGYDFTKYDSDGDGVMDMFVVLHSGYAAEGGNTFPDGCTLNDANHRIWSQGFPNVADEWTSSEKSGSIIFNNFAIASAFTTELCKGIYNKMGIIVHEYLHGIGLPDLYDQDLDDEYIPVGGTGSFDPMSNQYGWYV